MTMSCKKASSLMSKKQDESLSLGEKISLKWHFIVCASCMHIEKQYSRIKEICGLEEMSEVHLAETSQVKDCCLDDSVKDELRAKLKDTST